MCVIIIRQPGVTIPIAQLETACDINKHGFGLATAKKGRIHTIRSLDQPNDPEKVHNLLTKHKNELVFLHLRHATVGSVNRKNNHPLMVLERQGRTGIDLAFMHNGTLFRWTPKDDKEKSDTVNFTETFLVPLAKRIAPFNGPHKLLDDTFFKYLVSREAEQSVFVLFDGNGRYHIFNKDKGKEFDGWWASNDYSFDTDHYRSSKKKSYDYGRSNLGQHFELPWEEGYGAMPYEPELVYEKAEWEKELDIYDQDNKKVGKVEGAGTATIPSKGEVGRALFEFAAVRERVNGTVFVYGESIMSTETVNQNTNILKDLRVARRTFLEQSKLKSLNEIGRLAEKDLIEMCENYPVAMTSLILDLFRERIKLLQNNAAQAQTIRSLTEDKGAA